jgi:hypothetical protein
MIIVQLNPQWPVNTPKGEGYVVALLDYSQEHDTLFKVCINATGEYWDFPQSQVRGVKNFSLNRLNPTRLDKPPAIDELQGKTP